MKEYKKVTIIGDTSNFHLGSKLNYTEFRKLITVKHNILQEIPYDTFGVEFIPFSKFFYDIKKSKWWKGLENSDILIVHGEGLTEKRDNYVYPYLYFSQIAGELGIDSWLVNFSMYEIEPFLDFVKQFSYIACRDILTHKHLSDYDIDAILSFDCCVLDVKKQEYEEGDGTIIAIRGRKSIDQLIIDKFEKCVKLNCCWQWDKDALSLPSVYSYIERIGKSDFVLSTSFHGNIFSYLAGVPFISLDYSNKKYLALKLELLPDKGNFITLENNKIFDNAFRKEIYDYYQNLRGKLIKRARLNCR